MKTRWWWNVHFAGRRLLDGKVVVEDLGDVLQRKNDEIMVDYRQIILAKLATKTMQINVVKR